jgi:hypothetical protein
MPTFIAPVRAYDSRKTGKKLVANVPMKIPVAGLPTIPANAVGVAGNVTAVTPDAGWAIYAGPVPIALPAPTSAINFVKGQTIGNGFVLGLGADGTLTLIYLAPAGATTDVTVDLTSYWT